MRSAGRECPAGLFCAQKSRCPAGQRLFLFFLLFVFLPGERRVRRAGLGLALAAAGVVDDQDHGAEHSEFVDFFATYKATLPAIGRLMKVCRARVVPLFPVYDGETHRLTVLVRPPMDDLLEADDTTIARRMNEEVEVFVKPHTEQYTWILKLLKTRKPGEIEPYKRKELYPRKK